jgi:multimeric flavodoxin WrbA
MQILALNGSPRKGGNTDLLLDKILEGAMKAGLQTQKVHLYNYKISPCFDCRRCKQEPFLCSLKDDMIQLMKEMEQADVIIFGTPIYWYGSTATMKLLIDRLRPYIPNKKLARKKATIVIPSEEGPSICDPLIKMFQMSFQYIGMDYLGAFLTTAYEKGEIKNNQAELDRAYQFGVQLSKK